MYELHVNASCMRRHIISISHEGKTLGQYTTKSIDSYTWLNKIFEWKTNWVKWSQKEKDKVVQEEEFSWVQEKKNSFWQN